MHPTATALRSTPEDPVCSPPDPQQLPSIDYRKLLAPLAAIAAGLTEGELRLLLELAARAATAPQHTVRASSRDLERRTRLSRSTLFSAAASLGERGFILFRAGDAKKPTTWRVQLWDTLALPSGGGSIAEPPNPQGWFDSRTTTQPPTPAAPTLFETAPHVLSIDSDPSTSKYSDIDRALTALKLARPAAFPPSDLDECRAWLHQYQRKLGDGGRGQPHRHPPDARLVAQVLTIAPWEQIRAQLHAMLCDRIPAGAEYGWFPTVLLQRLHGWDPNAIRARRAALKIAARGSAAPAPVAPIAGPPPIGEHSPGPAWPNGQAEPGAVDEIRGTIRELGLLRPL